MLAATFIIFSALSMGVAERQRSLAMLRAVGAFKHQIGALVVYEGLLLAVAGLIVGIPLGWIWLKLLTLIFHDTFTAGAVLEASGIILGSISTIFTALAAASSPPGRRRASVRWKQCRLCRRRRRHGRRSDGR